MKGNNMHFYNELFQEQIAPFSFTKLEDSYMLQLQAGEYLMDVFATREEEGFLGNGYDWESLAMVFLEEVFDGDPEEFEFDSEADTFVVYSDHGEALADFAAAFKEACEDREQILDLFSRAELQ